MVNTQLPLPRPEIQLKYRSLRRARASRLSAHLPEGGSLPLPPRLQDLLQVRRAFDATFVQLPLWHHIFTTGEQMHTRR